MQDKVAVIDFGSQTSKLIARRIRDLGVYCEIFPYTVSRESLEVFAPKAFVLSGSYFSCSDEDAPKVQMEWLESAPVLAICYSMQALSKQLAGQISSHHVREFGAQKIQNMKDRMFEEIPDEHTVWMSHNDHVSELPPDFISLASSLHCANAAIKHRNKKIYGLQFHPELSHTQFGRQIFKNFLFKIAELKSTWKPASQVAQMAQHIHAKVQEKSVLMALSGGVDSSVCATLIHRAIGARLHCVFVDHGLHRQGDVETVRDYLQKALNLNVQIIDARELFFSALKGVTCPEQKRKIIGHCFIEAFKRAAGIGMPADASVIPVKTGIQDFAMPAQAGIIMNANSPCDASLHWHDKHFLAQGTLYPDVIESCAGTTLIKSHHNVGGLPKDLGFELLEPLRHLFKDEVRAIGKELGLDDSIVWRQPVPGPGLAVRIIGEVTREKCDVLRQADWIVRQEIEQHCSENQVQLPWQYFAVLLGDKSVGVMGDGRTYGYTVCVRCVQSEDGMSADWVEFPKAVLAKISSRILNEVAALSRVVYDISSKPPATIEWE